MGLSDYDYTAFFCVVFNFSIICAKDASLCPELNILIDVVLFRWGNVMV